MNYVVLWFLEIAMTLLIFATIGTGLSEDNYFRQRFDFNIYNDTKSKIRTKIIWYLMPLSGIFAAVCLLWTQIIKPSIKKYNNLPNN